MVGESEQPSDCSLLSQESMGVSHSPDNLNLPERAFSAAGAAFLSAILVNPLDVVKVVCHTLILCPNYVFILLFYVVWILLLRYLFFVFDRRDCKHRLLELLTPIHSVMSLVVWRFSAPTWYAAPF